STRDWSSDVCSSDLQVKDAYARLARLRNCVSVSDSTRSQLSLRVINSRPTKPLWDILRNPHTKGQESPRILVRFSIIYYSLDIISSNSLNIQSAVADSYEPGITSIYSSVRILRLFEAPHCRATYIPTLPTAGTAPLSLV